MSNNFKEQAGVGVDGHVLIKDRSTGEVLLDKYNAINFQNFAYAAAKLFTGQLGDTGNGFRISRMAFGNDATLIDVSGNIQYKIPNVDTPAGVLYNETYSKDIDPITDTIVEEHPDEAYSDMIFTVVLGYTEPDVSNTSILNPATGEPYPTQSVLDTDGSDYYIFDEIGLVTEEGDFLTHLIFHPIHKSANRELEIIYTIRIRAGQ